MKSYRLTEIFLGIVVASLILGFFSWSFYKVKPDQGGYEVYALFNKADGVQIGSDVKVAGVKVGSVSNITLDEETFQAKVTLHLKDIKIPCDSEIEILSSSLMGGKYLSITPGVENESLQPGEDFLHVQDAVSFENLIFQYFLNTNSSSDKKEDDKSAEKEDKKESGGNKSLEAKEKPKEAAQEKPLSKKDDTSNPQDNPAKEPSAPSSQAEEEDKAPASPPKEAPKNSTHTSSNSKDDLLETEPEPKGKTSSKPSKGLASPPPHQGREAPSVNTSTPPLSAMVPAKEKKPGPTLLLTSKGSPSSGGLKVSSPKIQKGAPPSLPSPSRIKQNVNLEKPKKTSYRRKLSGPRLIRGSEV